MQVVQNKPDLCGSMCAMNVFNGSCEKKKQQQWKKDITV